MKKFLHLTLPETPEVPEALDRRILAAASLRADGQRRRRMWMRFAVPTAVAAAAMLTAITCFAPFRETPRRSLPIRRVAGSRQSKPDMLALADLTNLEQDNFTLAAVSELEMSEENFSI